MAISNIAALMPEKMVAVEEASEITIGDYNPVAYRRTDGMGIDPLLEGEVIHLGDCVFTQEIIPMTLRTYLPLKDFDFKNNNDSGVGNTDDYYPSPTPNPTPNPPIEPLTPLLDGSGSSGAGSSSSGLNKLQVFSGNQVIPFDSVFLTGTDYNAFVAGKGGIVTEGKVYPNGEAIFIDKIRLSIEGNSMTVVQSSDFDDTPKLTIGHKIYGYIMNESGDNKSQFAGYVSSMTRKLDGKAERIVYECNDLTHYLDQFVTPSYYVYRPPTSGSSGTKTYKTVLREVLLRAGITKASITLPNHTCPPINWMFENVKTVLEWACNYFGKYVYFVSKNGELKVKATDSGSVIKSFRIPTRGEAVSANTKVLSFLPTTDFSRARSKIILVGDFPIKEVKREKTYAVPSGSMRTIFGSSTLKTWFADEIVYPKDCNRTGIFCYPTKPPPQGNTEIEWAKERSYYVPHYSFYLMIQAGKKKTFIPSLISDESMSAQFHRGWSLCVDPYSVAPLSITEIRSQVGDSFIFLDGLFFIPLSLRGKSVTIYENYAYKLNEPLTVSINTNYYGGVEVIKRPEFKKWDSPVRTIDDTTLMNTYLNTVKEYYKPMYGGTLIIDGLDIDLDLLGKLNITNTSLPSIEASNLFIHSIEYDITGKKTVVELTNKVYGSIPAFDIKRDIKRQKGEKDVQRGLVKKGGGSTFTSTTFGR